MANRHNRQNSKRQIEDSKLCNNNSVIIIVRRRDPKRYPSQQEPKVPKGLCGGQGSGSGSAGGKANPVQRGKTRVAGHRRHWQLFLCTVLYCRHAGRVRCGTQWRSRLSKLNSLNVRLFKVSCAVNSLLTQWGVQYCTWIDWKELGIL